MQYPENMDNTGDLDYSNTGGLDDSRVSKRDHNSSGESSTTARPPPQKQVKVSETEEVMNKEDIKNKDACECCLDFVALLGRDIDMAIVRQQGSDA